eukprot:GHUV01001033.1.p1 GENE.GHUV01001033.1~~GHUV01001033.1.p1  ORF type:complete len:584 (+),score=215.02 GHUV01001033.1:192-1943(+)
MHYAQFPINSGQFSSGPWLPAAAHPLAQLAVDGQVLSARYSGQVHPKADQIEPAAMRSKEAIAALTVLGAAALAAQQPGLMEPYQDVTNAQCGWAPALCFGSCPSIAGSSTSTPTPLHALQCLRDSSCYRSANAADSIVPKGSWAAVDCGVILQSGGGVGTGLDDSTSPLSACSRVAIAGAPTPCGSEALSGPQAGCKRTYNQAFQQQQLQYQQQQAQYHQRVQYQQVMHTQQQQHNQAPFMLLKQAQHTQHMQAAVRMQQVVMQKQQPQQQVQILFNAAAGHEVGGVQQRQLQRGQYAAVALQQLTAQPEQLLESQGSGSSSSSSTLNMVRQQHTVAPDLAVLMHQQYPQQYQQQQAVTALLTSVHRVQQQQQQPRVLLRPAASSGVLTVRTEAHDCHSNSNSWAAYLQRLKEQQLQPPSKRAATAAAYAALVNAATKQQQPLAVLRSGQQPTQLLQGPAAGLFDSSKLLGWAGQVLNCQLSEAYCMAQHIYARAAAQLDDMLLITLGVTQPMDKVAMLVCLWMATKLEGHRRQVVGCSKLATALQMVPWAVTSVELHIMQALDWRPYAGYGGQSSCVVSEV